HWRLHGKVGWLLASQDTVDIGRRTPKEVWEIGRVGHQAAAGYEIADRVDGGQTVFRGQGNDQLAVADPQRVRWNNQSPARLAADCFDRAFDGGGVPDDRSVRSRRQGLGNRLDRTKVATPG